MGTDLKNDNRMNVKFAIGTYEMEVERDVLEYEFTSIMGSLSTAVFQQLINSKESELPLTVEYGEVKSKVYFEKSPRLVEDGIMRMNDYIVERCRDLAESIIRIDK